VQDKKNESDKDSDEEVLSKEQQKKLKKKLLKQKELQIALEDEDLHGLDTALNATTLGAKTTNSEKNKNAREEEWKDRYQKKVESINK